ncbi:MAG: hypothetical protein SFU99_05320 [Saprospiraceae bacterium]|nr:hypothetical protein [Saprospiraceae bacterium]
MLICIGLALFFWLLTKLSKTYTYEREVVLKFELPKGSSFVEQPPSLLIAKIKGRGWELMFDYLISPEIVLFYDLKAQNLLSLSQNTLRIEVQQKLMFNNLSVAELNAKDLNLLMERQATKRVPIKLRDSLVFSQGYHLQTKRLKPDSVTLIGPISLLDSIFYWNTDSIFILDIKSNFKKIVPLAKAKGAIELHITATEVSVQAEQVTEKSLFIPLMVRNAPNGLKYFPETVKVTCVVGLSDYNKIKSEDFKVEIDLAEVSLTEGKNTLPIQMVKQSAQAITVQFTPKSAEFFIFKK